MNKFKNKIKRDRFKNDQQPKKNNEKIKKY